LVYIVQLYYNAQYDKHKIVMNFCLNYEFWFFNVKLLFFYRFYIFMYYLFMDPVCSLGGIHVQLYSLTSALHGGGGQSHAPAALSPRKNPSADWIWGSVNPRTGLGVLNKRKIPWQSRNQHLENMICRIIRLPWILGCDQPGKVNVLLKVWVWKKDIWSRYE
jgi:hypothetical protein